MISSRYAAVLKFIDYIITRCGQRPHIFRGTSVVHGDISSAIYRNHKELFGGFLSYLRPIDIEKDVVAIARKLYGPHISNIEILTELRHFGGETSVIDFSRNLFVALFFACYENPGKPGHIIALPTTGINIIPDDINYEDPHQVMSIIAPVRTPSSIFRTLFQSSVFVHVPDGVIDKDLCELIEVPADLKAGILDYLKEYHNIYEGTIFNDLFGFIKQQQITDEVQSIFYKGVAHATTGNYTEALEMIDKAIAMKSSNARYFVYRGHVRLKIDDFGSAMKDFDRAVELDPANAYHHYSCGYLRTCVDDFDGALPFMDRAIELAKKNAFFFSSRGSIKVKLNDDAGALHDFDQAIEIEPENTNYLEHRAKFKYALGDSNGAKKDNDLVIKLIQSTTKKPPETKV